MGIFSIVFPLLLAGCGGGGSSESTTSATSSTDSESIVLNGGAIKGVVSQGLINAWSLKPNADTGRYEPSTRLGAAARTDSQGRFKLPITGQSSGWVLIELSAGADTRMTCDVVPACFEGTPDAVAFGETFALADDFRLRAAVNLSDSREVYLTPLSTLAVTLAQESGAGLSGDSLSQAYADMELSFGLRPGTLQLPPPDLVRLNGFSGSTDAVQLAVINAAFLALVDGSHWSSIEDVLLDSEALIRDEGAFSSTASDNSKPSVEAVMLEAAVLSEGLKNKVTDPLMLASLDNVYARTESFYMAVAGDGTGGNESGSGGDTTALDRSARISWNAPGTRINGDGLSMGELRGYEIVYGRDANDLTHKIVIENASTTSHTIEKLDRGAWYFAVRAIDTEGLESPLSEVVSKSI